MTPSIKVPPKTRYLQIHEWQIAFCNNNHCAAMLLAFFSGWHDWKLIHDEYYKKSNDIAEMHGDGRPHSENAFLFFTTEELIDGLLGFYGKKAVLDGLQLLESLGVITTHKNPNPRYHFDKTKYFQFYPDVCNQWIDRNYSQNNQTTKKDTQAIDSKDRVKIADRSGKNALPSGESSQPSSEKARYITNNTNNTTNKNQSTNLNANFVDQKIKSDAGSKSNPDVQLIVDTIIQSGIPADRFRYPDTIEDIARLHQAGATVDLFLEALAIAKSNTKESGVRYLVKVVESLLEKSRKKQYTSSHHPPPNQNNILQESVDETDISKGAHWLEGF